MEQSAQHRPRPAHYGDQPQPPGQPGAAPAGYPQPMGNAGGQAYPGQGSGPGFPEQAGNAGFPGNPGNSGQGYQVPQMQQMPQVQQMPPAPQMPPVQQAQPVAPMPPVQPAPPMPQTYQQAPMAGPPQPQLYSSGPQPVQQPQPQPQQPYPYQAAAPVPPFGAQQQFPVQGMPQQGSLQQGPPQQGMPPGMPPQQPQAVDFPPPPNMQPVRDAFANGAAPFLEPGEQVYYGFILKLDDTIEETPRELMIAIEGQHHTLGDIHRTSRKMNRGMKWAANPMEALTDRLAEKSVEAMNRALAGPVFVGGWMSQAGWFVRYVRATAEDYGPGAYGALTNRRYLVFRGARLGGAAMRLVYALPRTAIAGVRTEGTKGAALHGRTPRAELHFADGSMVATMMPTKQGEQVAAILQVQQQMMQGQGQAPMQGQARY